MHRSISKCHAHMHDILIRASLHAIRGQMCYQVSSFFSNYDLAPFSS